MTRATAMATDWGVWVNECVVLATTQGAEWWALYTLRQPAGRMTCLVMSIAGSTWHVACDSRDDAEALRDHMISAGIPRTALAVKRLTACKRANTPTTPTTGD